MVQLKPVRFGCLGFQQSFAPIFYEQQFHILEKALDRRVTVQFYASTKNYNQAFMDGEIDMGLQAVQPLTIQYDQAVPIEVLDVVCLATQQGILVRDNKRFKEPANLIGQSIALTKGSGSHFGLGYNFSKLGLSLEQVAIKDLSLAKARETLAKNRVAAWVVPDPWIAYEISQKRGYRMANSGYPLYTVLVASAQFALERPRAYNIIKTTWPALKKDIINNPDKTQLAVANGLKVPTEIISQTWHNYDFGVGIDQNLQYYLQDVADLYSANNLIRPNPIFGETLVPLS